MKLSELRAGARRAVNRDLEQQLDTHRDYTNTAAESARRFLLFINSGGAVALLGFMGASEAVRAAPSSAWALGSFCLGLLVMAAVLAINYFTNASLFLRLQDDVVKLRRDQFDLDEFHQRNSDRVERHNSRIAAIVLCFAALGCWVIGLAIVCFGVLPHLAM